VFIEHVRYICFFNNKDKVRLNNRLLPPHGAKGVAETTPDGGLKLLVNLITVGQKLRALQWA
jgi:hypothetical protein